MNNFKFMSFLFNGLSLPGYFATVRKYWISIYRKIGVEYCVLGFLPSYSYWPNIDQYLFNIKLMNNSLNKHLAALYWSRIIHFSALESMWQKINNSISLLHHHRLYLYVIYTNFTSDSLI